VGADGAYSAVRQRMYEKLRAKGILTETDHGKLPSPVRAWLGRLRCWAQKSTPSSRSLTVNFIRSLERQAVFCK
jgi:hypothetical protein